MNTLYVNENCLLSEDLTLIQLKFLLIPICGVAGRGQVADAVVWFTNEKKFCTFLLQFKGTRQHFSGCIASLQAHIFCRLFRHRNFISRIYFNSDTPDIVLIGIVPNDPVCLFVGRS